MEREVDGTHFWDGDRRAAAAFATVLNGEGHLAWDTYLYYKARVPWTDPAPVPDDWAHQLAGPGAWPNPAHFGWGPDLIGWFRRLPS
ncbi:MAG: hypothetical protein ACRDHY_17825, partial [Anaerolineales bacterium]